MEVTYYDHSFNANEWFVILSVVILTFIVLKLPKILSTLASITHFMYGIFIGIAFDHNIGVPPFNFYDVNDNSSYQFMDFLSYVGYGPYSYFFIYLYIKLDIKGFKNIIYIISWTAFSIFWEWLSTQIGLFHYKQGYMLFYSIPIYLFVQTLQVVVYRLHTQEYKGNKVSKSKIESSKPWTTETAA